MATSQARSLRVRAAVALVLTAGFYLMAMAIAGGLLAIPYLQIATVGRVNLQLSVACVVAAGLLLWGILPRRDVFAPPGPRLDPRSQPRLFERLEHVSRSFSPRPPWSPAIVASWMSFDACST